MFEYERLNKQLYIYSIQNKQFFNGLKKYQKISHSNHDRGYNKLQYTIDEI